MPSHLRSSISLNSLLLLALACSEGNRLIASVDDTNPDTPEASEHTGLGAGGRVEAPGPNFGEKVNALAPLAEIAL